LTFGYYFNQNIDAVRFPNSLHTLTFGVIFNQKINNAIFHEIYDHSHKITFESCKWPKSLHKIIHIDFNNKIKSLHKIYYMENVINIVIYERQIGKFTKCATRNT
jgi:hypothetical protein